MIIVPANGKADGIIGMEMSHSAPHTGLQSLQWPCLPEFGLAKSLEQQWIER